MTWVFANLDSVLDALAEHVVYALIPVLLGLLFAIPLGWVANRNGTLRTVMTNAAGLLYTVPSLALFVFMPPLLGTQILDPVNVVVALTVYTVALLVRTVSDALSAVPGNVVDAANAMGYTPLRRFVGVELPLAVPVIVAGLRVAAVSTISLVTVGAVIGFGGLGLLFTEGFNRSNDAQIVAGIVLVLLLALVVDSALLLAGRLLTLAAGPDREGGDMTYFGWLFDGANWTGPTGILARLAEHLGYTALTLLVAVVIAVPLGAWIGHTGRGGFVVVGLANGLRALPTLGLLVLLATLTGLSLVGPIITLIVLAVPAVLAGTYAGIRNVDPAVVDAATGMGMRGSEVLWKVELPNALPLIIGGLRSATLQVIATATIAAYVSLGGSAGSSSTASASATSA